MMKMAMTPQRNQLAVLSNYEFRNNTDFDRSLFSMFGYTDFEALLIGGAGGRSGRCDGRTVGFKNSFVASSAGGGGGFIRVKGKLTDLPVLAPIVVGLPGGNGSDSGNNVKAGNGSNGGSSTFAGYSATGGRGGLGGKYDVSADGSDATITVGHGGAGGYNSESVGAAGAQSTTATANVSGGVHSAAAAVFPTNGTSAIGTGSVVAAGGGGGGGAGRVRILDDFQEDAQNGAQGAVGPGNYDSPGTPPNDNQGGPGGGCNAIDFLGFSLNYGLAENLSFAQGVVMIKIS